MPDSRIAFSVAPRIHTPGWFISTTTSIRSPAPRNTESSVCGVGTGISVERDHLHLVAGKRDPPVLDRAGIQKVNQHPLPFANPDGLAGAQRLVVDRVGHGAHFEAVRIAIHRRRLLEKRPVMGVVVHGRPWFR